MKKKNIINLIKYYAEDNDAGFRGEAYEIARDFERAGDCQLAAYVLALLSSVDVFLPQMGESPPLFLEKMEKKGGTPMFPEVITRDLLGVVHAVGHNVGINKFLLQGASGTGKTEAVKQLARILGRDIYRVDTAAAVGTDSGQAQKNIAFLFKIINHFLHPEKVIVLFEGIDVSPAMLKALDGISDSMILIVETNCYPYIGQALTGKFDAVIDFNRYTREDLMEIAEGMLDKFLAGSKPSNRDIRLFRKLVGLLSPLPCPGELKSIIKTAVAFRNPEDVSDYFRRLYYGVCHKKPEDLKELQSQKFTLREIEILVGKSKSSVARRLKEEEEIER